MGSGAHKSRVINAFKRVERNYRKVTEAYLVKAASKYAEQALVDAVDDYLESSGVRQQLTGNTIAGFTAGIYLDGTLRGLINALEVYPGLRKPTSGYTQPGDTGFEDYGSGEMIGRRPNPRRVLEYSDASGLEFQPTDPGGSSIADTAEFLRRKRTRKGEVAIVIANYTPYIDFLVKSRDFDILATLSGNAEHDIIRAFKATPFNPDEYVSGRGDAINIAELDITGPDDSFLQALHEKLFEQWLKTINTT